jgi:hypothetical protein
MIDHKKLFHITMSVFAFIGAAAIFVVAWWFIFGRSHEADTNTNSGVVINSFTECEAAGYPVMESYPRQCAAGGKTFTEVITNTNQVVNTNRNIAERTACNNIKYGYHITYPNDWNVYKPSQGEAMLTTCESGDALIFFAPELSGGVNDQIEFSIEALDSERREGTDYDGINSLNDYLAINAPQIIEELTVDDQRMVRLGNDTYITYYDGIIYRFNTYNLTDNDTDIFFESIDFSSTNWQPFDSTVTNGWQTYTNSEMGFSFQYPVELGEVVYSESEGEIGNMYRINFSDSNSLIIGGISNNYSAGREGSFLDSRGYYEEDENYYFHFVDSKDDTEYPLNPVEKITVDGRTILIVNRYSFIGHDNIDGPYLHPGDNALGALLIFQEGYKYPGMAIWDKDLNNISEITFKNILSTFQFTD